MEDILGITLEHAGPIGVALCVLAVYLLHRFDRLPTYRARIDEVEHPHATPTERARVLALITEETPYGEPMTDRDDHAPRRRLTRYERLEALADSGCDTWAEARGER